MAEQKKQTFQIGELQFNDPNVDKETFNIEDHLEIRKKYRVAAKIHRKVREYARAKIVPGVDLYTAVEDIEGYLRQCCSNKGAESLTKSKLGQAFPLGVSVNNCAAHYCPLKNDTRTVKADDIIKVDFGVHNNGYLVDSAFSLWWDSKFDILGEASREATNAGIKESGVDVPLTHLGDVIEEIIISYEWEGKPIQPVRNLSGHKVDRFTIHAGKSIPLHKNAKDAGRMEDGEVYACETFASTGNGLIHDEYPTSHYMCSPEAVALDSFRGNAGQRQLFTLLKNSFGTLAWCPRWLDTMKVPNYNLYLDSLVEIGYVNDYPQLVDKKGSYVSQFEHTFMVGEWGKEVFTRSDDY